MSYNIIGKLARSLLDPAEESVRNVPFARTAAVSRQIAQRSVAAY
jgi:hypothetical protein